MRKESSSSFSEQYGDVYPLLDVVVGLQFWSESLARSLARPQLPDDEHVGDSHGDDRQEEDHGRDEAVVSGA